MLKNNLFLTGLLTSSAVTTYPNGDTFIKMCLSVLLGIALWKAIARPVRRRTVKEKISDYLGQIVLAIVCAYVIKKYVELENDFEIILASFIAGLFSYGLLLVYRAVTSPKFVSFLKKRYFKK